MIHTDEVLISTLRGIGHQLNSRLGLIRDLTLAIENNNLWANVQYAQQILSLTDESIGIVRKLFSADPVMAIVNTQFISFRDVLNSLNKWKEVFPLAITIVDCSTDMLLDVALLVPEVTRETLLVLITNAVEAMPSGEEVRIGVQIRDDIRTIDILVVDSGHGIPQSIQDILFTQPVTTRSGYSRGIGLFWSGRAVQQVGGTLALVESNVEGSTFLLSIPYMLPQG